jgi:adhesin transport system membrane fusion protein
MARIDEVARGEGKVIPSSQVQVLQSLDGGIVEEIVAHEGAIVEKGQLLIRIDPTRFESSLRETTVQVDALKIKSIRLQALADNKDFVIPADMNQIDATLIQQEHDLFLSKRAGLTAALGALREQTKQRQQELTEVIARNEQAKKSFELAEKEYVLTKPLVASGAVSDVELLRLEREVARLRGERDSSAAQIPRIQFAIQETFRKTEEAELQFRNEVRNELSEVSSKLNSLSQGSLALADRVKHSEVRSPVRGTIKQMFVNTVGGVVQPGKDIIEIVPLDDTLLLEARVLPKDIAFIRPGQLALVKFTAYDFAIYGGLDATVEHISADTVTDEKGNAFYLVRVRTQTATLGDAKLPIIPGMTAEVDLLTGKRTVLSYILKPVLRAKANALQES